MCQKALAPARSRSEHRARARRCASIRTSCRSRRRRSRGSTVKVASVATAFPSGQSPLDVKLDDVRRAVELGADEIDMVIDRGAMLVGRLREGVRRDRGDERGVRRGAPQGHPRDGRARLATTSSARRARSAIAAGGDFIKTSTGKIQPGRDAAGHARDARGDPRSLLRDRPRDRDEARRRRPHGEAGAPLPRASSRRRSATRGSRRTSSASARARSSTTCSCSSKKSGRATTRPPKTSRRTDDETSKSAREAKRCTARRRSRRRVAAARARFRRGVGIRARARGDRSRQASSRATSSSSAAGGVAPRSGKYFDDDQPEHRAEARRDRRGERAGRRRRRAGRARRATTSTGRRCAGASARSTSSASRARSRRRRASSPSSSRWTAASRSRSRATSTSRSPRRTSSITRAGPTSSTTRSTAARARPLGVAGQIIPWNFPLLMAAWKIAPALACGNTVVLKPAETTPLTALLLAQIIEEAELPPGVVNIVTGAGETGAALVEPPGRRTRSPSPARPRSASASSARSPARRRGSRSSSAARRRTSSSPTRRIDQAVEGIINGIYFNQGHVCCAGSRLLVEESVHDVVVRKLARPHGDAPRRRSARQEHRRRRDQLEDAAREDHASSSPRGEEEGAERFSAPCALPSKGYWFAPTFFTGVAQSSRIAREEIFGPVLSIMTFRTPDEAVEKANNTMYGLSAGVWTDKGAKIFWMAQQPQGRRRLGEHVQQVRPELAVRRLQGERLRPRGRPPGPRRVRGGRVMTTTKTDEPAQTRGATAATRATRSARDARDAADGVDRRARVSREQGVQDVRRRRVRPLRVRAVLPGAERRERDGSADPDVRQRAARLAQGRARRGARGEERAATAGRRARRSTAGRSSIASPR